MAVGPAQTFDLTPYLGAARERVHQIYRVFLVIGVGFTIAGAAAGWFVAGALNSTFLLLLVLFAAGGFSPSLIAIAAKPWQNVVAVRLGPTGFTLVLSTGKEEEHRWTELGLLVLITQQDAPMSKDPAAARAEGMTVAPSQFKAAWIGSDLRQALVDGATTHGLLVTQETFPGPGPRSNPSPVRVNEWLISQSPMGARSALPVTSVMDPAQLPRWGAEQVVKFDGASYPPNRAIDGPWDYWLTSLTVSARGLALVDNRGKSRTIDWGSPNANFLLKRRLNPPTQLILSPTAAWWLQFTPGGGSAGIPAAAFNAILEAGQSAGLTVTMQRTAFVPRGGPVVFLASVQLQRPVVGG